MDCKPKLRFPEFDGEWEEKILGETLEATLGGGTPSRRKSSYWNGDIPWASVKDLDNKKYKESTLEFITEEGLSKSSSKLIPAESLIISTRMGLGRGFINKKPISINQDLKGLIPNEIINIEFLYYWYKRKSNYIETLGKGSTVKGLRLEELHALSFSVPSMEEQEKIASFLSKVDSKIDLLEKKQELWETYKKGIMQQIFSQKLRFKDENGEEYPDWEEKKFNQIFNFIPTNSFSRANLNYETGDVYNIHYGDIHTKYLILLDFEKTEVPFINDDVNLERIKTESYCKDGDLVIADASEDYEDIGKAIELKNLRNKRVLAGLHTFLVRDKAGHTKSGYRCYMLSDVNVKLQIKKFATGVSVLGISKSNLGSIKLRVPSLQEQSNIACILSAIGSKIEQLNKELELNKKFKRGLLQQMFC